MNVSASKVVVAVIFGASMAAGCAPELQSGSFPALISDEATESAAWSLYTYAAAPSALQSARAALQGNGTATEEHRLEADDLYGPEGSSASFQGSLDSARTAASIHLIGRDAGHISLADDGKKLRIALIEGEPASWSRWQNALEGARLAMWKLQYQQLLETEDLEAFRSTSIVTVLVGLEDGSSSKIDVSEHATTSEMTGRGLTKTTRAGTMAVLYEPLHYNIAERGPERSDGPSAGLAYAISHLNTATGGSLLGGLKVFASATITGNGLTGRVGGFPEKYDAAMLAGAELLLVAPGNLAEIPSGGPLEVLAVRSLAEAVEIICRIRGEDAVPSGLCS